MAIDFNPMLARALAKEQMAMQGAYGLGQLLGSESAKGKFNELKDKVGDSNLLNMAKKGLDKVPNIKNISMPQLEGIRERLMNIMPGGLLQSMGRPYDIQGIDRPEVNQEGFNQLMNNQIQSYNPMQIPIPKYNIEDMNTAAQDELIDYNVSGGNTLGGVNVGDARGLTDNVYNFDFTTDLMSTPKKVDNKYSVETYKNAVNFNKGLGYLDEYVNPTSKSLLDEQIDNINSMGLNILPTTRTPFLINTIGRGTRGLLGYTKGLQMGIGG